MKLEKFEGNLTLSPSERNDWESLITCNPGVFYGNDMFYMLYHATGNDKEHVIRLELATSRDGSYSEGHSNRSIFFPSVDGPDSGCVESPRIMKFNGEYYITYAYQSVPPGQYWKFGHNEVLLPERDKYAPAAIVKNLGNTGLAVTIDFCHLRRLGRLTSPMLDDRDVILFPEKVNEQFVMLHRPKRYIGERFDIEYPSIWIEFSDDLLDWEGKESHLLLTERKNTWEEKIGGSTPPLKTDKGWLILCHDVEHGGEGYYRMGALLLDLDNPLKILAKAHESVLEPEENFEINGYYNGCVLPAGNMIMDDTPFMYYSSADKYVCVATCSVNELFSYLLTDYKV